MAQNINNPDKPYKKNVHANHRQRVKERFRLSGLDNMQEHNVMELLLFYAIPRKDTNELAHYLINEFGSFSAVLDAPLEALQQIDGVGKEAATFIKLIPELHRYYEANKNKDTKTITDAKSAAKYLSSYFIGVPVEIFVVMYLDAKGGLIKCSQVAQGTDTMVQTDFSSILKTAVLLDSKAIVVAHNHPNGFAVPSKEDIIMTDKLSNLCKTLGIILCEHFIYNTTDYCQVSKAKGIKPGTCIF